MIFTTHALRKPLLKSIRTPTSSSHIFPSVTRSLHESQIRHAIMMPAMSPFATTGGTIRKWNKKEGEAFVAGDVLLQIESEFGCLNVEAERSGTLGKILFPDGTSDIPVEKVIALVATDANELASFQMQQQPRIPPPPRLRVSPRFQLPPSRSSTTPTEQSKPRLMPAVHRAPSVFDKDSLQTSGLSAVRGMVIDHANWRSDSTAHVRVAASSGNEAEIQMTGEAIRRKIVSNLTSSSRDTMSSSSTKKCATAEYFEGII